MFFALSLTIACFAIISINWIIHYDYINCCPNRHGRVLKAQRVTVQNLL